MTAIEQIDVQERRRVVDEFRRIGSLVPDKCPSGIDLDGPLARQLAQASSLAANQIRSMEQTFPSALPASSATAADGDAPPFSFLREAAEEQLSALLGDERPQTIAVVLSQLPPERAGAVLTRLPPLLQAEVIRRLADLDSSDPETLREIEQALFARLSRQFAIERKRAAGPETIAKILAACDSRVAAGISSSLAEHDGPLAERLGRRPVHFDDLARFDDAALGAIFRAAEPEVVLAALFGAPPQLVERGSRPHGPRGGEILRRQVGLPGTNPPPRRRQCSAADCRLGRADVARQPPKTTRAA